MRSAAEVQLSLLRLQDEASVKQIRPVAMQRFHAHSNQCVYNPDGAQQNRNYPCHKCGNAFTRKNNLYNHLKFQCGQLPRFNCPYCSYRTKHSSNVRSHIRRIHPNENVYVLDMSTKQDHQPR
ncbi:zinc finger X-chromosomal protein-like [Mycetomoellerius zeteki]|uniref:zinc finger X-chromosomal protein-like n=1 Tax=Mycetomoellerius zeteki TaxID=64791 RepID=UPI00084EA339|nr:PREDICTED: zinc finger X-chromosomal protein-like [Trachymyrmex zeteki]